MNDLEERIRKLATPTELERLDQGVGALISAARAETRGHRTPQVPLWFAAVACLIFALVGGGVATWLQDDSDAEAAPAIVVIEATPEVERWLERALQSDLDKNQDRHYQSIEALYIAGKDKPLLTDNGTGL